jgi:predicted phosphodiesterase
MSSILNIKKTQMKMQKITIIFLLLVLPGFHVLSQHFTKQPYLLAPESNSVTVRWETDSETECKAAYGRKSSLNKTAPVVLRGEKNGFFLYEATIEGLRPCSSYGYRVSLPDEVSEIHHFKTVCRKTKGFRFVAMGDSRSNPGTFKKVMAGIERSEPDLIISMGDLVENGGNFDQWNKFYFSVVRNIVGDVPLVSTLGDHEGDSDNGELFRYYMLKDEPVDKQWFSFDFGNAHFISLDYRHPYDKEMIDWFIKDITASDADWNFVFMHRPVYDFGAHRSRWGQDVWSELFHEYKIDVVFAGHSHIYERFYPVLNADDKNNWPVTYITTGGGGAGLYDISSSEYLASAESVNHFIAVDVSSNELKLKTIDINGEVFDRLEIKQDKGRFADDYLKKAIDEKALKLQSMFLAGISFSLNYLPFKHHAAPVEIEFKSMVDEDVDYSIKLTPEAAENYEMEPVSGTLKKLGKSTVKLRVFSKSDMTITTWGEMTPDLTLELTYSYKGKKYTLKGGPAHYWPEIY